MGSGTQEDPFRPEGIDIYPVWSSIDLRDDPTVVTGDCMVQVHQTAKGLKVPPNDLPDKAAIMQVLHNRNYLAKVKPSLSRGVKEIWLGELIYEEKVPGPRQFSDLDPSDNFTRANENPIGGNWTNPGVNHAFQILSNLLTGAGTNNGSAIFWNANVPSNDQFSEITVNTLGSNTDWGASCRMQNIAAKTLYTAGAYSGSRDIWKMVNDTFTSLAGTSAPSISVGDVVRVEAEGSTIRHKVNGALYGTATDTSITSGNWAIFQVAVDSKFSLWTGGNISVAAGAFHENTYRQMMTA
jgi:hypothetical protein